MSSTSHNRDLTLLVVGNATSALGNAVYVLAVTLLLKEVTQSASALGAFHFVALFPAFIFSPLIGAAIDRIDRRRIVVVSDLARGVLMLSAAALLVLVENTTVVLVLLVAFLSGIGQGFFVPAVQAWLPSLVPQERLPRATTARVASTQIANLAGNAVGGLLYVVLGAPLLFAANGITFIVSGIQEGLIPPRRSVKQGRSESILRAAREGIRLAFATPGVPSLIASQAGLYALSPVLTLSLPFVVIDELGLPGSAVGYVLAAGLAGAVLAFVALRKESPNRLLSRPILVAAYAALAFSFLLLSVTVTTATLVIVAIVSGAGAALLYLYATTWIQTRMPSELHGRLFSLVEAANAGVAPTAYLVAGALLSAMGRDLRWLLYAGVGLLALAWSVRLLAVQRILSSDAR